MDNIVLIGMPGAGKSTVGVILAKTLGMHFTDTDILVQEQAGALLQDIIGTEGTARFLETEEKTILSLRCHHTVIATGGSAVFSPQAMAALKKGGVVVYLSVSFDAMVRRLRNITTRGIVLPAGQDLAAMYSQRIPLYEQYADVTIDCSTDDVEVIVGNIIEALKKMPG